MATLKSFKGFIPLELGLGRHYINGFEYVDDNDQSYYVATDNAKAYLISSNIINYYPETCFPKVKRIILDPIQFGMTLDEVVDLTEAEITQHQITNYFSDTLAEAKALTYKKQERVKIFELDEVYECVEIAPTATGYASSSPVQVGTDLYFISYDAGGFGQLYKQTNAGVTSVPYTFSANGDGYNPIGSIAADGTSLYIETASGGANSRGTILKYNTVTSTVSKIVDLDSTTTGYSNGGLIRLQSTDKQIHNNNLYLCTADGGANGYGIISRIDINTGAIVKLYDFVLKSSFIQDNYVTGKAPAFIVNGFYYVFNANVIIKVDLTTDAVTSATTPVTYTDAVNTNNQYAASGFLDTNGDIYVGLTYGRGGIMRIETSNADNITITNTATSSIGASVYIGTYAIFKEGNFIYAKSHFPNGITYKWDIVNNTLAEDSSTHVLPGTASLRVFNGQFNATSNILYYTNGTGVNTQNKIYKYDVAASAGVEVFDTQSSATATTDDEYIIEINQSATANLYLRVRDNHTKSVALDSNSLGIDVTTTRGVTTNIAFPISNTDFWSYQYATNTTSNDALDIKGLAGFKVISDNLTLLSKTASSNVFNGSDLFLPEGIYSIQASFYMNGQVGSNLLKLEVKPIGVSTILTESSVDSNKLFTTRFTTYFDAVLIDSTTATSGIKVRINGIDTAGSFLNIYDIRLNITKIGDNI